MLHAEQTDPLSIQGSREQIRELHRCLAHSDPASMDVAPGLLGPGEQRPSEDLLRRLRAVLSAPAGRVDVELSSPGTLRRHRIVLSRSGAVRWSELADAAADAQVLDAPADAAPRNSTPGGAAPAELSLFPTEMLPGVVLRLCALSPVETLPAGIVVGLSGETAAGLWVEDSTARSEAWDAVIRSSRALPPSLAPHLEEAPPQAARVSRFRPDGTARASTAETLLLRGRRLILEADGAQPRLVGTDPTGAARRLVSILAPRR